MTNIKKNKNLKDNIKINLNSNDKDIEIYEEIFEKELLKFKDIDIKLEKNPSYFHPYNYINDIFDYYPYNISNAQLNDFLVSARGFMLHFEHEKYENLEIEKQKESQQQKFINQINQQNKLKINYFLNEVYLLLLNEIKKLNSNLNENILKNDDLNYDFEKIENFINENQINIDYSKIAKIITQNQTTYKFNGLEIKYLPYFIVKDKFFKREILNNFGFALAFCENIDLEDIFFAIKNEPFVISILPDFLKKSKLFLILILKLNPYAVKYISEEFKNNTFFQKALIYYVKGDLQYFCNNIFLPKNIIDDIFKLKDSIKNINSLQRDFINIENFIKNYENLINNRFINNISINNEYFFKNIETEKNKLENLIKENKTQNSLKNQYNFLNIDNSIYINKINELNYIKNNFQNLFFYEINNIKEIIQDLDFKRKYIESGGLNQLDIENIENFEFYFNRVYANEIYNYRNNALKIIKDFFYSILDRKYLQMSKTAMNNMLNNILDEEIYNIDSENQNEFDYYKEIYQIFYENYSYDEWQYYSKEHLYSPLYKEIQYLYEKIATKEQQKQFIKLLNNYINKSKSLNIIKYLPKYLINNNDFQYNLRQKIIKGKYFKNNLFYLTYVSTNNLSFKEIEFYCLNEPFIITILNPLIRENDILRSQCILTNYTIIKYLHKYYVNMAQIISIVMYNLKFNKNDIKLIANYFNLSVDKLFDIYNHLYLVFSYSSKLKLNKIKKDLENNNQNINSQELESLHKIFINKLKIIVNHYAFNNLNWSNTYEYLFLSILKELNLIK